jgi:Acetyltransferase (GNAT) domain
MRTTLRWNVEKLVEISSEHLTAWDAAIEYSAVRHPLLDCGFVAPLVKYFGHSCDLYFAVGREQSAVQAVALLERRSYGVWHVFTPIHAPLALLVIGNHTASNSHRVLRQLVAALPEPALVLHVPRQDPDISEIAHASPDYDAEWHVHELTCSIHIDGSFDSYWNGRSRNLRKKIRGVVNRLERESHTYSLETYTTVDQMDESTGIHGIVESSGWKGRSGTFVGAAIATHSFYSEVMHHFAETHCATAYRLVVDGEVIASQLAITAGEMCVLLKTGYKESWAHMSPGRLLDYLMLQQLFASDATRRIEYYTDASDDDLRWATARRPVVSVSYYRHNTLLGIAQLVRWLRFAARKLLAA